MQKFEFCEICYSDYIWLMSTYTPSGRVDKRLDRDPRERAIAELGLAGWQMVTVLPASTGHISRYFFQRPMP